MSEDRVTYGYGANGELIEFRDGPVRCADCVHLCDVMDERDQVICRVCEYGCDAGDWYAVPDGQELDECPDYEAL